MKLKIIAVVEYDYNNIDDAKAHIREQLASGEYLDPVKELDVVLVPEQEA